MTSSDLPRPESRPSAPPGTPSAEALATGGAETAIDPNVLQRRAADPDASVWVGASAGTGKTKVLTDRVLRLMLAGTPPQRILCLTFTKAAAAEMANRLNRTLAAWATVEDGTLDAALAGLTARRPDADLRREARRLFARVLEAPGGMKIQTIHAFCQSLLRRFPVEAEVPPHFELIDDRTADELMRETQDRLFQAPPSDVAEALDRLAAETTEGGFGKLIRALNAERGRLSRLLEAHGGVAPLADRVRGSLGLAPGDTAESLRRAACAEGAFDEPALRRVAGALTDLGGKTGAEAGAVLASWLAADPDGRLARWDGLCRKLLTKDGRLNSKIATKAVLAAQPDCEDVLSAEAERLRAVDGLCRAAEVAAATRALLTVGSAIVGRYAAAKAERALVDYDDLILATVELLDRPGVAPWVLYKLDGGLDHVLIDEAQDTNPDQWKVVERLTDEFFAGDDGSGRTRTVFAVGDEKQSIFSFQRADPAEFARMRRHFAGRAEAAAAGWWPVELIVSFRSTRAVLAAVDAVFARDEARAGVVSDPATAIRHQPFRRGQAGLVELWPLLEPEERAEPEAWTPPTEQLAGTDPAALMAEHVAGTIKGWIDRGERLESRDRPIRPGDVLVLLRKRSDFFPRLVRALKDRGVPVAGIDRMVLTEQLAVMDLAALGRFLLMPEDDLTLAALLKSPLIGLDEDRLFALAHDRKGTLWRALQAKAAGDPAFAAAHAWLADLLGRVDFEAPYELYARLLAAPCPGDRISGRRALAGRLGPEAEDPVDEFLALAMEAERRHPPSLQRFLHWLEAAATEVKREMEQAGGQVRIMTVHGAKGLQAPVVILPDTVSKPKSEPPILWPDGAGPGGDVPIWVPRAELRDPVSAEARDRAKARTDQEYRRLLYVALTRAEDRLYVGGYRRKDPAADDCWYRLVADALAEHEEVERAPFPAWEGDALRLTHPQVAERKREEAEAETEAAEPLPPWALRPPAPEPEPTVPLTPSRPSEPDPAVRPPLAGDDGARFRRGTLIHRLLETLPELPRTERPAAAARFLARPGHGLAEDDQKALVAEALAVLDDPAAAPLFGPSSRAEVPIVGRVGGQVLSGQIDRLAVTEDAVLIVDYKTNRPPPETEEAVAPVYLRQMAAYRAALRGVYPDREVRCALLWTDAPRLMHLSDALLDAHAP